MNQDNIHSPCPDIVEEGRLLRVLCLIVGGNDLPPLLCCVRPAFTEPRGKVLFDTFWQSVGYLLEIDGDPGSGSHENASPFQIVAVEEEAQTHLMHHQGF
jgi:hypothetical protein